MTGDHAKSEPLAEELALLAHDIRSAFTDMMTGLELIDDSALGTADRQQLERVRASGEGLFRLLEVALSNVLGQNNAELPTAPVHLNRLLNDLMRRWAHTGGPHEPAARAVVSAAPDLPEVIQCNHVAVERILANLIGNALFHSGNGLVTLEVRQHSETELCFTVLDQGPGFPTNLVSSGTAGSRALPAWQTGAGHGLGLSISQSLCERMGGRITLRNTAEGHGAAEFWLPIAAVTELAADNRVADSALQGVRVLLADDSATQLLLLSQYLSQMGAHATMVRDGASAVAALRLGDFGAAILDQDMPGLSGPEVCAEIRASGGELARLPVVILSAHNEPHIRARAMAAGADAVLQKPIASAAFLGQALSDVMGAGTGVTLPDTCIDPKDFLHLLEVAGADLAAELIERFQADLAAVKAQLLAALPQFDWQTLRSASHVLIALSGTAGAHLLSEGARAFNLAANALDTEHIKENAKQLLERLDELIAFVDKIAAERNSEA